MTDWRTTLPAPRPPRPLRELQAAADGSHVALHKRNEHAYLCVAASRTALAKLHVERIPHSWDRDVVAECLEQIENAIDGMARANGVRIVDQAGESYPPRFPLPDTDTPRQSPAPRRIARRAYPPCRSGPVWSRQAKSRRAGHVTPRPGQAESCQAKSVKPRPAKPSRIESCLAVPVVLCRSCCAVSCCAKSCPAMPCRPGRVLSGCAKPSPVKSCRAGPCRSVSAARRSPGHAAGGHPRGPHATLPPR